MIVMFLIWKVFKRTEFVRLSEMDLVTDRYDLNPETAGDSQIDQGVTVGEGEEMVGSRKRKFFALRPGEEKGVLGKVKRVAMWLFL